MIHLVNIKMNAYHIFTELTAGQKLETTSENLLLLMSTQNIFENKIETAFVHLL